MNGRLGTWVKGNYPDSKSDLFAMFIERGFDMIFLNGYSAMVTMQSWMFLSSFEKLRERLLNEVTIECMAHMSNMVMGIAFGTAATVWNKSYKQDYNGSFCYVEYEDIGELNKPVEFPPVNERNKANKNSDYALGYRASAAYFKKIPGSPIAYWVSKHIINVFERHRQIYGISISEGQNITADNDKYLRLCWEVDRFKVEPAGKWSFYSKGGSFRKWFGNLDYVVDWSENADFNEGLMQFRNQVGSNITDNVQITAIIKRRI